MFLICFVVSFGYAKGQNTCSTPPCPASLLGDVAVTTVSGTEASTGVTFHPGENIYGPFEAGFGAQQANVLSRLGCASGKGYIQGGVDTELSEEVMGHDCGVTLPRIEGGTYIGLLDQCGGHTREYHFHQKLSCLYEVPVGGHSTQVGKGLDGQFIYGKYEDDATLATPKLDACGGHFGITPDSNGKRIYHYHVQDRAPHTFGCYGPAIAEDGSYTLVTLEMCRSLYSGCDPANAVSLTTAFGTVQYELWCPCYDESGANHNANERSVFEGDAADIRCEGAECVTFDATDGIVSAAQNQAGSVIATLVITVLVALLR